MRQDRVASVTGEEADPATFAVRPRLAGLEDCGISRRNRSRRGASASGANLPQRGDGQVCPNPVWSAPSHAGNRPHLRPRSGWFSAGSPAGRWNRRAHERRFQRRSPALSACGRFSVGDCRLADRGCPIGAPCTRQRPCNINAWMDRCPFRVMKQCEGRNTVELIALRASPSARA